MIETICRDCGQRYQVGTDHACPKKPAAKKSTAARKDVPAPKAQGQQPRTASSGASLPKSDARGAGTQAPSVDTNSKRGPGRPRTITDIKAYRLQKQRERRAGLKSEDAR